MREMLQQREARLCCGQAARTGAVRWSGAQDGLPRTRFDDDNTDASGWGEPRTS